MLMGQQQVHGQCLQGKRMLAALHDYTAVPLPLHMFHCFALHQCLLSPEGGKFHVMVMVAHVLAQLSTKIDIGLH
jgi:hypothetical protein